MPKSVSGPTQRAATISNPRAGETLPRVLGLDLMRSIAIICVVIVHAGWMKNHCGYPWIPIINGVDLFFVLSGFLIGGIILRQLVDPEQVGFKQLKRFWIRRWFRTLPNYYLILLLNILVVALGLISNDMSDFSWKFFVFAQNLFGYFQGFFWESWSLSIEEWFYLLFPLILLACLNLFPHANVSDRRHLYLACAILFFLCSFLLRLLVGSRMELDDYWYAVKIQKVVVYHFDGIAFGLMGAYVSHYHERLWHRCRNWTFVLGVAIIVLYYFVPWDVRHQATVTMRVFMFSAGCALLLPRFSTIKTAPAWFAKPVTHVSKISYSMYLINLALVSQVIEKNVAITNLQQAWLWYIVYWVAVILFSTIIYYFYEQPIMRLRERF